MKERAVEEEGGMSQIELRLNAQILRKVVDTEMAAGKVPDTIKGKVAQAENL